VSVPGLTLRQVRFTNTAFWRNPASAFFTFVFPLLFLVVFTSLLGSGTTVQNGQSFNLSTYYVAAMASFSVITACYTNIAMTTAFQREGGILKRTRGTPLPGPAYLGARVMHAILIAFVLVALCGAFGAAFYHADVPAGSDLLRLIVTILVGAASFAALGLAVTAIVPNADAAPAIVNATILPLLFLSGIFIPLGDDAPAWITTVAAIFPIKHFGDAFAGAYYGAPFFPFRWFDLAIVLLWGIGGLLAAARWFRWEPRR
jgi:ABC-2 type transport system permease protein